MEGPLIFYRAGLLLQCNRSRAALVETTNDARRPVLFSKFGYRASAYSGAAPCWSNSREVRIEIFGRFDLSSRTELHLPGVDQIAEHQASVCANVASFIVGVPNGSAEAGKRP
jgi:hypothetical protein